MQATARQIAKILYDVSHVIICLIFSIMVYNTQMESEAKASALISELADFTISVSKTSWNETELGRKVDRYFDANFRQAEMIRTLLADNESLQDFGFAVMVSYR